MLAAVGTELVGGSALGDQVAQFVADEHQLVNAGPAAVAGVVAAVAAFAVEELPALGVLRPQVQLHQDFLARLELAAAILANLAHQPLRQDALHAGRDQERLQTHVAHARDRARRVVGVQRAEYQVAGQGRLHRDLRRFQIANLAHEDLVRVLPQDRAQRRREREADLVVDRHLHDAVDVVLDRVLGGDDLFGNLIELVERRIERRRLAGAGRTGDEHDAVGFVDHLAEGGQGDRVHANLGEVEADVGAVQDADDHRLAEHRRQHADAHVHGVAADVELDAAVLGHAPLGDVQVGHDFDARADGHGQVARRRHHFIEHAIATIAHLVLVLERLEMDVRGVVLDGHQHHHVEQLADRGGVLDFHQAFEVDAGFVAAFTHFWILFQRLNDVHDGLFLAGIGLAQHFVDGGLRAEDGIDLLDTKEVAQVIQGRQVDRVADDHRQGAVDVAERQDLVDAGHGLGHEGSRFGGDLDL